MPYLIEELIVKDTLTKHLFTDHIKFIEPKSLKIKEGPVAINIIEEHPFIVTEHYPTNLYNL